MSDSDPPAWKIIPFFKSTSITSTVAFYRDHLRFKVGGIHPTNTQSPGESDPLTPNFCSLFMGPGAAANIYFLTSAAPSKAMIALKDPEALEAYHSTLKQEGKVEFVEELQDKEWGYRQFTIRDEDGNELAFFSFID